MYIIEYCDNPDHPQSWKIGKIQYGDDFPDQFEKVSRVLDRYMYLNDMYRIINSWLE